VGNRQPVFLAPDRRTQRRGEAPGATACAGYGAGWYWGVGAVATLLFFASVVIHELSHALVGNRLGQEVRRITLFIFGGIAQLSREPRSAAFELAITAVGPLTSLMLTGVFWLIASWLAG
jgi:Zn-dependent protease